MLNKFFAAIFAIAVLFSTSGCTTLADARTAKGSGASRTYAVSKETIWKAVPSVLTELGLSLAGENKQEGYILAQRGMTAFSYGENIAIFVEPVSGVTKTQVEVVSKKAMSTNIFAPSWENDILNKLDERLKPQSNAASEIEEGVPDKSTSLASRTPALMNSSTSQKLRDLQSLRNDGVITEEDFKKKRRQLLEEL